MSSSIETFRKNLQEKNNITPTTTFADLVKRKAEVIGDKVFLTFIRDFDKDIDETYTYRDMYLQSNRVSNALLKSGLKQGDGISLYQINSPEFLFVLFGAWKIGVYVVLVNTGLKGDGLQFIIDHSDSKLLATHWSLLDNYLKIKDQLPKIEHIIVDMNEAPEDFKLSNGILSLQEFMNASDEDADIKINPNDMATLIYTSGTTDLPKAAIFFIGACMELLSLVQFFGLIDGHHQEQNYILAYHYFMGMHFNYALCLVIMLKSPSCFQKDFLHQDYGT